MTKAKTTHDLEQRGELINIAAALLINHVSDDSGDYPKTVPKWLISNIEKHNDFLRTLSIRISDVVNASQQSLAAHNKQVILDAIKATAAIATVSDGTVSMRYSICITSRLKEHANKLGAGKS